VYGFAIKPDVTFYFKVSTDVAIERILSSRPKLKYYEAGMDLSLSNDPYESYRIFQGRIIEQYDSMVHTEGFNVINADEPIEEQQQRVREEVSGILPHSDDVALTHSSPH
jgi:dTMP kinase